MEIKNYIKTYNNFFKLEVLSTFIKYLNSSHFQAAKIVGDAEGNEVQEDSIRKTKVYNFLPYSDSLTNIHWYNFLHLGFSNYIQRYKYDLQIYDMPIAGITDISALKYENSGFYNYHVDHVYTIPRTLSCILLLNNDYEGGELCFTDPSRKEEHIIKVEANKLIIWPSNFLFPHKVNPVTKGIRYSVIAWAY